MRSADHPHSCRACHGTGWQPAEPRWETVEGRAHRYDTWRPCEHHWADDDNGWRPDQPIAPDHDRVIAALEHGVTRGLAELAALRTATAPVDQPTLEL